MKPLFIVPLGCAFAAFCASPLLAQEKELLTGKAAMGDWTHDAPGVRRKITVADLPPPFATESASNGPKKVARPDSAWPLVPEGFKVDLYATDFKQPRVIVTAPNGDLFVTESSANRISVLRDADGDGKPEIREEFVTGLNKPFGIAFYPVGPNPEFIYIGNTDAVVRYPYKNGDLKVTGPQQTIVDLSGGGLLKGGGHWTRDVAFSNDGSKMYVSVGSKSNISDDPVEDRRARIFEYTPDGKNEKVYGYGIRNPVGLAVDPQTGAVWTSVNERDGLGDDLVPDYITKVKEGGFYGWPWFYLGANPEPRHNGKHAELAKSVLVPDVLIQSHSASLDLAFYTGKEFPERYRMNLFAAEHGSWNRTRRTGYKVIMVPLQDGSSSGEYEDFMTGFVTPDGDVWGRPVGITTGKDGALFVSDDGGHCIWRVTYPAKN